MRIMAQAILFDSDGVLIDSHSHVRAAWHQLAEEFGLDEAELTENMVGVRAIDTISRFLPGPRRLAAVRRLEDIEVDLAKGSIPMPGAVEMLDQLPAGSWTIVTSGSLRLAETRWLAAGIPVPPKVITAEDVRAGKPDPEPYLTAAAALGVDPRRTVVFEDASPGGEAGRDAGAAVVAVGHQPWSTTPVARIDDLSQVTVDAGLSGITLVVET
jgi:sugar-phosphatase